MMNSPLYNGKRKAPYRSGTNESIFPLIYNRTASQNIDNDQPMALNMHVFANNAVFPMVDDNEQPLISSSVQRGTYLNEKLTANSSTKYRPANLQRRHLQPTLRTNDTNELQDQQNQLKPDQGLMQNYPQEKQIQANKAQDLNKQNTIQYEEKQNFQQENAQKMINIDNQISQKLDLDEQTVSNPVLLQTRSPTKYKKLVEQPKSSLLTSSQHIGSQLYNERMNNNPQVYQSQFQQILNPSLTPNNRKIFPQSYGMHLGGNDQDDMDSKHLTPSQRQNSKIPVLNYLDRENQIIRAKLYQNEIARQQYQVQASLNRHQVDRVNMNASAPLVLPQNQYQESNQQQISERQLNQPQESTLGTQRQSNGQTIEQPQNEVISSGGQNIYSSQQLETLHQNPLELVENQVLQKDAQPQAPIQLNYQEPLHQYIPTQIESQINSQDIKLYEQQLKKNPTLSPTNQIVNTNSEQLQNKFQDQYSLPNTIQAQNAKLAPLYMTNGSPTRNNNVNHYRSGMNQFAPLDKIHTVLYSDQPYYSRSKANSQLSHYSTVENQPFMSPNSNYSRVNISHKYNGRNQLQMPKHLNNIATHQYTGYSNKI